MSKLTSLSVVNKNAGSFPSKIVLLQAMDLFFGLLFSCSFKNKMALSCAPVFSYAQAVTNVLV